MDLDAYVAAHRGEWARLRDLGKKRKLSGADADELLDLYQRTATHLSLIRSAAPDPSLVQYLSTVLAKARARALGTRTSGWSSAAGFFTTTFPAILYRTRRWWGITALINVVVGFVIGMWVKANPQVQTSFVSPDEIDQLVNHDFAHYYSTYAARDFALQVWTNNAWIAALCIAFGVLALPVFFVLATNILNVGVMGGILAAHGKAGEFFGLILPHGMLELTAVFIASGAGLRLCWAWIVPGARTRLDNLAHEARATAAVAMGLAVVLLVSGIIEAFVTPSPLPTWARIGIGLVAEVAFLTYVFTLGRRAADRGATGDVEEFDAGSFAPTAA